MELYFLDVEPMMYGETSEEDTDTTEMDTSPPRRSDKGGHIQGNTGTDVVGRGKDGRAKHSTKKGDLGGSDDEDHYHKQEELELGIGKKKKKEKKSGKRGTSPVGGGTRGKGAKETSGQKGLDVKKTLGGRVEKKGPKKWRG